MQANSVNFLRDILNNGRYFYIPVYQRNYSWQDEQCKQLVKDIMMIYNGEYSDHFIGTVVWKADDGNSDNLSVIDGQQRLTTMFLFILAMKNNCENEALIDELDRIVSNKFTQQTRLTPIKSDNEVFTEIVNSRASNVVRKSNRIFANYNFFNKYIADNNLDIVKLWNSIGKLSAIKMELHRTDNPQVIFESINSTGMSLSIADLIRNFLLMNESYDVQTRLFENYWYQFENKLGTDKLVAFFEHYLNIHITEKSVNRSNMYVYFKKYFMENNFTAESVLVHLSPYIDAYAFLCNDESTSLFGINDNAKLEKYRDELIELENTTAFMFLMPTILDFNNGVLNEEELQYSFELIVSYLFRRSLVGLNTNALAGTFRRLYRQTMDNKDKYGWKDALDYALVTSKNNTTVYFPSDEIFFDCLHSRNLYGKFRYTYHLLLSLENDGNKTKFDIESFSIEHVMPQTISKYWQDVLGNNWKELHEENVNDLGNLTLTSYNSELSNSDFNSKKEIMLEERHIKLNDYFHDVNEWNDIEIQKRGKELAHKALKIWKYPTINKEISDMVQVDRYNTISLYDLLVDYFSIKPAQIIIDSQVYKGNTIRDAYENVLRHCMQIDLDVFDSNFVDSNDYTRISKGTTYYLISKDKRRVIMSREVNGYYYDTNRNGKNLFGMASDILNKYQINPEEVIIKYYK